MPYSSLDRSPRRARRFGVRLAALAIGLTALSQVVPGKAATPTSSTIHIGEAGAATATWTGGPLAGNPDPLGPPAPNCAAGQCDHETVVLSAPAGYAGSNNIVLTATATTIGTGGSTWDIAILDSGGNALATASAGTNPDSVTLSHAVPGTYIVEVDGDIATGDSYTGTIGVTSTPVTAQQSLPTGGLSFGREVVTDPFRLGTEPTIAVGPTDPVAAPQGTIYEGPIFGFSTTQSFVTRSDNGGQTFNQLGIPGVGKVGNCTGGGDEDIATDQFAKDLFFIDLGGEPSVPASVSNDRGNTFTSVCEANDQNGANEFPDRQWLSTDYVHGYEWYIYRDGLVNASTPTDSFTNHPVYGEFIKHAPLPTMAGTAGSANLAFTSLCHDTGGFDTACVTDVAIAGNAVTDNYGPAKGNTYLAETTGHGVGIMVITPTGVTERTAVPGAGAILFPTVAVDNAGNIYETYTDSGTYQLRYTHSSDQGLTWSPPTTVNASPAATTVMPWIVAGDDGRVDIVFYGSPSPQAPSTNSGPWSAYMLQSLNAHAASPSWAQQVMTDRPNHVEPVCLNGLGCTTNTGPSGDRELGDFFRVALDASGRAVVSFADGNNQLGQEVANGPIPAPSFANFVRQATGPSLFTSVGTVPAIPVLTNTVTVPEHANPIPFSGPTAPGPSDTALELLGSTTAVTTAGTATSVNVTMNISNLDATAAITSPGLPVATYITRWWFNGQVYYAAAEDHATQWSFFSGQVAPVSDGLAIKYAYYPSGGSATGTVTPGPNGTISISVPAASVGNPATTDTLYSVTSYALTHAAPTAPTPPTATSFTDFPQIADVLPAYNVVPGPATNIPEARSTVLLLLVGIGGIAIAVAPWRRRRRSVAA